MAMQSLRKKGEDMKISERSQSIKETQQKDPESQPYSDSSKTPNQDKEPVISRDSKSRKTDKRSIKDQVPPLNIQSPAMTRTHSKAS